MGENIKCSCLDWSVFSMRVLIAAIMLYYGIPKLIGLGAGNFFGLPGFVGLIVGIAEVIAAVCILAGVWFKWSNNTIAAILIVATVWITGPRIGWLSAELQRNLLVIVGALLISSTGPGSISLKKDKSKTQNM